MARIRRAIRPSTGCHVMPEPAGVSIRVPPARPRPVLTTLAGPRPALSAVGGPRRADDRKVAVASIVVAGLFLAAAVLAAAAGWLRGVSLAPWLPLHLAMAGGASTAIAGLMPFFVAALSATAPAGPRLRGGAVALVAIGAVLVSVRGIAPSVAWAPVIGGVLFLAGFGAVAQAIPKSFPLRRK